MYEHELPIPSLQNVFYDRNSDYSWSQLNEKTFLTDVILHLEKLMGNGFLEYDFYFFSSHNPLAFPDSSIKNSKKKVLFFISDESGGDCAHLASKYCKIFKSYLSAESDVCDVYPFPLGCVDEVSDIKGPIVADREIDVFFSGNLNRTRIALYCELSRFFKRIPSLIAYPLIYFLSRIKLIPLRFSLKEKQGSWRVMFTGRFKDGLPADEYAKLLAQAKIVLCPHGFQSAETFRHSEALRAGAVIVSEILPDTRLYKESPIVMVKNWRDGIYVAKELLTDIEKIQELQDKSIAYYESRLSALATAKYVASVLNET